MNDNINVLLPKEKPIHIKSFKGIDVYKINTCKFKTNSINIFFHDNINRDTVTKNALIPAVLRRGTKKLPETKELAFYLEELFGASFDCGVSKKGEQQILHFYIECVNDYYTSNLGSQANLFEKVFELLVDIITNPVLENEAFKDEYIYQEKENLKTLIEGRLNDKFSYAVDRCLEEMCKEERFGVYEYGNVEDLKDIDANNLYQHYLHVLQALPISVYISGDIEDRTVENTIEMLLKINRGNIKKLDKPVIEKKVFEVNNVIEKMNIAQGKLVLGFRTNVPPDSNDYHALMVYNGILGGGMHSKLFVNVREKESMAYSVFSNLEKFKGIMVIGSGIEIDNKEKALEIILKQLDDIKQGNISDYEYESTLKRFETGINSIKDSQLQVVDFYLSQNISGTNNTLDGLISKVKAVRKEDVSKIAEKICLDTVYFLTSN